MLDVKPVNVLLGVRFKLLKSHAPTTENEKAIMLEVRYASVVSSLMYVMVSTRPDISQAVRIVSRHMSNPVKEHWRAIK